MAEVTPFDAVVIGTGQAGPSLAVRLAGEGLKTAIVERHRFGGTCVNVGCIPTKALVASARVAHMARQAETYGVSIPGDVQVDMTKVRARKDAIVKQSTEGVEGWLRSTGKLTVLEGHGRFLSPNTLQVGEREISADRIFINVGARPRVPDLPGLDDVSFLTSSTILDLDFLPKHLIVVGGSYIGLEFAQMYRRFGSEVTVIEQGDRLVGREDPDVSEAILGILEGEGIEVRLGAECLSASAHSDGVSIGLECAEQAPTASGSHLLMAVGRLPNTHDLGLEKAGIEVDKRGYIPVDDQLRTNLSHVWALGEVNRRGGFTHTAYNDYEIVAGNLLDGENRTVQDRIACYGLFIDPPLGRVGMTEQQARNSGRKVLMGRMSMKRVGRAKERGETQGFMKVLVDGETERILGASLLGIGGDEVVHGILDIMYADAPYAVIQRAVHIHPTVSELIPTMLQELRPLR
ncbi:MAG: FAD-containing oxidoreductase [Deltaproteobacteria bacterium]|nr:FAD-containing oxidoreductase [Deltaproteobacteria bacterium]